MSRFRERLMISPTARFILLLSSVFITVSFITLPKYPGSPSVFCVFSIAMIVMVILAFVGPRQRVYDFFSLFLFLGFWVKLVLHSLIGYDYVEPVGYFNFSSPSWDYVLLTTTAGTLGVIVARLLYIHLSIKKVQPIDAHQVCVPWWFKRYRGAVWLLTVALAVGVNLWNLSAAFYQVGVNVKVLLPFRLNVVVAWLINGGMGLWLVTLIHWEGSQKLGRLSLMVMAEAALSSTTALSRMMYPVRTLPFLLFYGEKYFAKQVRREYLVKTVATFVLLFAVTMVAVMHLRISTYPGKALDLIPPSELTALGITGNVTPPTVPNSPSHSPSDPNLVKRAVLRGAVRETLMLVTDRWIGLEGVMAVTSFPDAGSLFGQVLFESPKTGFNSIYQTVSKSRFVTQEAFTFLTLPGIMAVLSYSLSLPAMFVGMAAITLLLCGVEYYALRLLGNELFLTLAGAAMANVVCQTNFPYLTLVFIIETVIAISFVRLIALVPEPTKQLASLSPRGL